MAEEQGRAARQPSFYEVRELRAGSPAIDLGVRHVSMSYWEALEFAFEYLERHDPDREGTVGRVEIVRVQGNDRVSVWSYRASDVATDNRDLLSVWGFNVTQAWSVPR